MLYRLVSASGCATFPTVVDQPAPSSARVTSRRIVDSAAVETQLPLTVLTTLVGTRRFAESPDVFEQWTISYLLSGAVYSCTSSGVPSLPVSIVRSLLVCCAHTRTARLSYLSRRIRVWPSLALCSSSCSASADKELVSSRGQTSFY